MPGQSTDQGRLLPLPKNLDATAPQKYFLATGTWRDTEQDNFSLAAKQAPLLPAKCSQRGSKPKVLSEREYLLVYHKYSSALGFLLSPGWKGVGSLCQLPPAHLWEAAINFCWLYGSRCSRGWCSGLTDWTAAGCILHLFLIPHHSKTEKHRGKQQVWVREIDSYLSGHKKCRLGSVCPIPRPQSLGFPKWKAKWPLFQG